MVAPPRQNLQINAGRLAVMLGVTEMTISNWKREGMPHEKDGQGNVVFSWFACHEWWLQNKYAGPDSRSGRTPAKYESEAKLFQVRAEREALELEEYKLTLIPAAALEPAWVQAATIVKDRVLAIPAALKVLIPTLTNEDLAKAREVCRGVLEALTECPSTQQPSQTPAQLTESAD